MKKPWSKKSTQSGAATSGTATSGGAQPGGAQPGGDTPSARHPRRNRLASAGLALAVLAAGGAVWASTQTGTSPVSASRDGTASQDGTVPAATAATTPAVAEASSSAPAPTSEAPPAAPAEAPAPAILPAQAPPPNPPGVPPADPAPVDRTNKSDEELATIPQPVAPPVPLVAKKQVKSGVSATITELQAVQGEAMGIGEVGGPALRFRVTVVNDTAAEVSLASALVDVSYGKDSTPSSPLSGPDVAEFPASVLPGQSASGVFVFSVPADQRDTVRIYFNLDAGTPIASFEGQAPA